MIIALHGFLGLASDWDLIPGLKVDARNLWVDANLDYNAWTEKFLSAIQGKPLLLGYSMGGRLAMHAAVKAPELFSGAIFISANPGLTDKSDRIKRLDVDQQWGSRFLNDQWHAVVQDWNKQPVLKSESKLKLERKEKDFDRKALRSAMDFWSLGWQRDLRAELQSLKLPQLYLTGAKDQKFTSLTKEFVKSENHLVISGAGHRVPWDNPEDFVKYVSEFERSITSSSAR